jgi:phenylalanyl-tRNA synthetase beta subunit
MRAAELVRSGACGQIDAAASLALALGGGRARSPGAGIAELLDATASAVVARSAELRPQSISRLCAALTQDLGDADGSDAVVTVTPPSRRFDLEIEEDLIEEVVRIWGFERLPVRPPRASASMRPVPEDRRSAALLSNVVSAGRSGDISAAIASWRSSSLMRPSRIAAA